MLEPIAWGSIFSKIITSVTTRLYDEGKTLFLMVFYRNGSLPNNKHMHDFPSTETWSLFKIEACSIVNVDGKITS